MCLGGGGGTGRGVWVLVADVGVEVVVRLSGRVMRS